MAPHTTEGKDYPSLHSLVDIPKLLVICLVSVVSFLPFCHMGFAMADDHPLSRDMLCTSLHHASNYASAFVCWNTSLFSGKLHDPLCPKHMLSSLQAFLLPWLEFYLPPGSLYIFSGLCQSFTTCHSFLCE